MATKKRSSRKPSGSAIAMTLMIAGAGLIAWFGAGVGSPSPVSPGKDTITLAAETTPAEAETAAVARAGSLPTRVVIPAAGIDTSISEVGVVQHNGKYVWETAWRSAGHHIDSARPGQPGNMVLTGHVSVADSANVPVFANLSQVSEGDVVEVYSGDEVHRYAVTKVMVAPPSAVRLLKQDHASKVTLVTCTPDLKNRLIVVGTLL